VSLPYLFHPVAIEQQENIWLYTCKRWGEAQAQADRYIDGLHAQLIKVIENPALQRKLPENAIKSVRYFRYKRHFIFVKDSLKTPSSLFVLSILHQSMDIPARLAELLDQF
jgi:plasmid stabilization system protein ParE